MSDYYDPSGGIQLRRWPSLTVPSLIDPWLPIVEYEAGDKYSQRISLFGFKTFGRLGAGDRWMRTGTVIRLAHNYEWAILVTGETCRLGRVLASPLQLDRAGRREWAEKVGI